MTRIRFNGCDLSHAPRGTPVGADGSVATVSDVVDRFLDAVGARDFDAIAACFHDDAKMRALVPSRLRDESGPDAIAERYRFWR
jgi:ketosteroid isomerase-like protein